MTALKYFVPLSRSQYALTPVILQKSIHSVLLSRCSHLLSHRISHSAQSEHFSIEKSVDIAIRLNRKLSTSTTTISEENMSTAVYEEIKDLPNHPEKTLIDVREPDELKQTGVIPTSINIPREYFGTITLIKQFNRSLCLSSAVADVTNALNLEDDEFKGKYGRTKPSNTSEVIFSCRSGMRAGKAAVAAAGLGFEK